MNAKKKKNLAKRKQIIDLLKEKEMRYHELRDKTGISEATLSRILEELKGQGLADNEKGYWRWYIYREKYKASQLSSMIKHSKLHLLPGLLALLEYHAPGRYQMTTTNTPNTHVSPEQLKQLKELAESHLKTCAKYRPIYKNLIKFRKLKSKLEKLRTKQTDKLLGQLKGKIVAYNRKWLHKRTKNGTHILVVPPKAKGEQESLAYLFMTAEDGSKKDFPYVFGPFKTTEEIVNVFGPQISKKDAGVLKTLKKEKPDEIFISVRVSGEGAIAVLDKFIRTRFSMMSVYQELAGQIYLLKMRVETDQPLDGHCTLCPSFIIEEDSQRTLHTD